MGMLDARTEASPTRSASACSRDDLPWATVHRDQRRSGRAADADPDATHFGGLLPSAAELLAADPDVLRASGMSARKSATLRAIAGRMSDDEVEAC